MRDQLPEQAWRFYYRLQFYLDMPAILRIFRFRDLRKSYYRELWRQAAENVGAEFTAWHFGFYRITRDGLTTLVRQGSVMLDDHLTLEVMGNKVLTYALLGEKGCAVPEHCRYTMRSFSDAEKFLAAHGGPVVVKPASGTGGGWGVTTGIVTARALRKASRRAARFDGDLLVEAQMSGRSYRLLYLNGRFLDAVRRDPPTLTGDGRHTIRQLIAMENRRRLSEKPVTALSPLTLDQDCVNKLRSLGLRPSSRLESGRTIEVKQAVNENCAAQNHSVAAEVHPETQALGARLVTDLGVRFAGLDIHCQDISAPLSRSNGCISEINTTPGIHHHYLVSNAAEQVPVAECLLEEMFGKRQGVMVLGKSEDDDETAAKPAAGSGSQAA